MGIRESDVHRCVLAERTRLSRKGSRSRYDNRVDVDLTAIQLCVGSERQVCNAVQCFGQIRQELRYADLELVDVT